MKPPGFSPPDSLFKIMEVYLGPAGFQPRESVAPCALLPSGHSPAQPAGQAPGARQMVRPWALGSSGRRREEAGGGEGYGRSEEGSSHRSCWPEAAADLALNEALRAQPTPSASGRGSAFLLVGPK